MYLLHVFLPAKGTVQAMKITIITTILIAIIIKIITIIITITIKI